MRFRPSVAAVLRSRPTYIVNVANQGAITNLPATAEVEVEAVTDSSGVRPVVMGEAPTLLKALLEKRFVWHELVADAAVTGDRTKALQAMLIDEMAIIPEKARSMLDELLKASRDLLPQFFPRTGRVRTSGHQGIRSPRERGEVSTLLLSLPQFDMVGFTIAEKSAFNYRLLRSKGVTVRKTIDVLIGTFCAEHGLQLIHHDSDFDLMAKHIGLDIV